MGESSAKGLRGSEMEDVIFNGSSLRPAHDLAEVCLTLHGDLTLLGEIAQSGEAQVSRRIGRGTGSVFRINGKEVRARDVQTTFADYSAGSRSASMIGQGQVSFVVEAKPEERRRLLEDAAGIGGMHGRRREAELKLQGTEANLTRVHDRLAQQQERHRELEKQSRQAQRFMKIQAEIRRSEAVLHLARLDATTKAVETAEQLIGDYEEAGRASEVSLSTLKTQKSEIEADLERQRSDRDTKAQSHARLKERFDRLDAERKLQLVRLDELERHLRQLEADAQEIADRLAADGETTRMGSERLEAWRNEQSDLEHAIDQLSKKTHQQSEAIERHRGRLRTLAEERAHEQAALHTAKAQQRAISDRELAIRRRLDAIDEELPPLASNLDPGDQKPNHDLDRLRSQLAELQRRRRGYSLEVVELRRLFDERSLAQKEAVEAHRLEELTLRDTQNEVSRAHERIDELSRLSVRYQSDRAESLREIETLEQRGAALGTDALSSELELARQARQDLEFEQENAVTHEHDVRDRLVEAQEETADSQARLAQLNAERSALEPLLNDMGERPILRDVIPEAGYELALAAALGDDLLADHASEAPVHWRDVTAPDGHHSPKLPEGTTPLSQHVQCHAKIRSRLEQIGVVHDANQAADLLPRLATGQRLVTKGGGLWRWDGFVRTTEAADPGAAKVRQHRRWSTLLTEIDECQAQCQIASRRLLGLKSEHQEAANRRAALAKDLDRVSRELDERERKLTAAIQEKGFVESRLGERRQGVETVERELARVAELVDEQRELLAKHVDLEAQQEAWHREQDRIQRVSEELADLGERVRVLDDERQAADRAIEQLSSELDQKRSEADAARREREAERQGLEARKQALIHEKALLEEENLAVLSTAEEVDAQVMRLEASLSEADRCVIAAEEHFEALQSDHDANVRELAMSRQRKAEIKIHIEQITSDQARRAQERTGLESKAAELGSRLERAQDEFERARDALEDDQNRAALEREVETIAHALEETVAQTERMTARLKEVQDQIEDSESTLIETRERMAAARRDLEHAKAQRAEARRNVTDKIQRMPPDLRGELNDLEMPAAHQLDALQQRIFQLSASRDRMGAVNLRAADEVREIEAEIGVTEKEEAELQAAVERLNRGISMLNSEARQRLNDVFGTVDDHFRRLFTRLFGGGRAHLRLVNMEDPLRAGLELDAMPPGKKLQNITLLSGGEKSLTALALVFALFLTRPSPLCVLDEVDAALDDANVDRFVLLMEEIAKETGTRFLVVTHHPLSMARMNRLYGVTMAEQGVSKLVSVALDKAIQMRAA